jgi:uncharacterized protein Yka (UPF0111/DUF47 family)
MINPVLDSIEDALSEVQSTLTRQVEKVSALVKEAELADELMRSGREQVERAKTTLARTRQLTRSVNEQREILATLRATLRAVCMRSSGSQ